MSNPTLSTRLRLSLLNGLVTGAIAAWFYASVAGKSGDLWVAMKFPPLSYGAMILVCCVNTYVFFGLLRAWAPTRGWKGFVLGGAVATVGSFFCSAAMGLGTGRTEELLLATLLFIPVSGCVGSIAGVILAKTVLGEA